MSDRAAEAVPRKKCDHICLLDDDHVDRGEPHFYGYENPSPRSERVPTAAQIEAAMLDALEGQAGVLRQNVPRSEWRSAAARMTTLLAARSVTQPPNGDA